jgi:tRNA-specific 2-thiouridylase
MVTPEAHVVGRHVGLSFYTLGQRQGLGIGGSRAGTGEPWFVAQKRIERNELVVVQGHDDVRLLSHALEADQCSWVSGAAPESASYAAKTRYRQEDASCLLRVPAPEHLQLQFEAAQWAVTPGQSAVVYDGEVCLGGGIISGSSG